MAESRYGPTNDPAFLRTIAGWFQEFGEVFFILRFHAAAGSKSYEFMSSVEDLRRRLAELPPRTCVTALRGRHLEIRGVVDDAFIERAVGAIPDGRWWLLAGLDLVTYGKGSWYPDSGGESRAELQACLSEDFRGKRVALGLEPDWFEESDGVISAVVPLADGTVEAGIY